MKENKWLKEIPLILVMLTPFLVYAWLLPLLPEKLPSHYSIKDGGWIVLLMSVVLTATAITVIYSYYIYKKTIQQTTDL